MLSKKQLISCMLILLSLLTACAAASGETRALLVACSDFQTQPDLGSAISGNLHMIGSALLGASPSLSKLSIEDGTLGTADALGTAIDSAFGQAQEDDLSILYLCTHGVLSSADDDQAYLLLGDGQTESPLGSQELYQLLTPVQGEKLLVLDACFSGALLGRGSPDSLRLPGVKPVPAAFTSSFLADSSIHVLTSASGGESSWYYDGEGLQSGAVSYFASALSCGLGLYGTVEADLNGDGQVTLSELHHHLRVSVPSSASQLLSCRADSLVLPHAQGAMLSRPLTGFSYGATLLAARDPILDFSFTVTSETSVQYRLVEYENGAWNWNESQTFLDGESPLTPGRHMRSMTLPTVKESDSGYLMLQVFSVSDSGLILCSERLIAVQPVMENASMIIHAPEVFSSPGSSEIAIGASIGAPAQITLSIHDEEGLLVRRLASGQCTRPADDNTLYGYWDGRDTEGRIVSDGIYTITAETFVGFSRTKASAQLIVRRD